MEFFVFNPPIDRARADLRELRGFIWCDHFHLLATVIAPGAGWVVSPAYDQPPVLLNRDLNSPFRVATAF